MSSLILRKGDSMSIALGLIGPMFKHPYQLCSADFDVKPSQYPAS